MSHKAPPQMLALCVQFSLQDHCTVAANTPISTEYVDSCFRSIPFDADVRRDTVNTLQQLCNIYAFKGQLMEPNEYGIPPLDIDAELSRVMTAEYANDFDFHQDLAFVFQKGYDAHTKYALPQGYGQFTLGMGVVPVYDKVKQKYVLEATIDSKPNGVFSQMRAIQGLDQHVGKYIVKINNQEPNAGLNKIAQEISFYEREAQARFNEYVTEGVFKRSTRTYAHRAPESLVFELDDGQIIIVDYMLYSSSDVHSVQDIIAKNKRANTVDIVRNAPLLARAPSSLAEDEGLELLSDGTDIKLYKARTTPVSFVLTVPTFSPDDVATFVSDFQAAMAILDTYDDGYLVVNVAGNGGGYITLGYRMLAVLAPFVQPRWGHYSILKNKLNEFFVTSKHPNNTFSTQERFELESGKIYTENEWFFDVSEEHFGGHFAGQYAFDLAYDELPASVYDSLLNTKTPNWLDTPENTKMAFVTDGTCGSTCACFMMRGREANAGLYLQLGGNPALPDLANVASFAGGSVMNTAYTDLFDLSEFGVKKFITSASFGWAHEQVYSFNQPNETLEYLPVRVNDKLDVYWSQSGWYAPQKMFEIATLAVQKLQKCYDFQWRMDGGCGDGSKHTIYGRGCINGEFKGECKIVACEKGYWLKNGKCSVIPVKYEPSKDNTNLIIILTCSIAGGLLLLTGVGFVAAYYLKKYKHYKPIEAKESV